MNVDILTLMMVQVKSPKMTSMTAGQVIPSSLYHIISMLLNRNLSLKCDICFISVIKMWIFDVIRWSLEDFDTRWFVWWIFTGTISLLSNIWIVWHRPQSALFREIRSENSILHWNFTFADKIFHFQFQWAAWISLSILFESFQFRSVISRHF